MAHCKSRVECLADDPAIAELAHGASGPYVIGATGGSGTRVFARIVRGSGLYIGATLNVSEDAIAFGEFSDRWINRLAWSDPHPPVVAAAAADLQSVLREHLRAMPATARAWGWKEPRSSFLLPFLHRHFPQMKFLHVVRDGRDMAFSSNQNQLRKHGPTVLDGPEQSWSEPLRSIALWSRHNLRVAEYGETHLGNRYRRVRFEDLCAAPAATIRRVMDFFELRDGSEAIARVDVSPPPSLRRWRCQREIAPDAFDRIAGAALRKFGY